MDFVRLQNRTQSTILCERCAVADRFWARVRGLQFRATLAQGEGLLITSCPSVHMMNVRFALDVIFLSADNRVTDWVENLLPGFHFYVAKPRSGPDGTEFGKPVTAIELPVGTIAARGVQLGDEIAQQRA